MIRIFETYWATLIVYLLGIVLVLMLGYEYALLLRKVNSHNLVEVTQPLEFNQPTKN